MRLVVAVLRRGHTFYSLDAVKEELSYPARMLAPRGFSGQIPFLSLGSDVGKRVAVHEGESKASGAYVVEDVAVDDGTRRRLVFLDNQMLVQSEATLKEVKNKHRTRLVVDHGAISTYQSFVCVCVQLASVREGRTAVLGLGGGGLCMFLRKCFSNLKITAVDIDPDMWLIARNYFELKTDDNLQVQIMDGLDFLKDEAERGSKYSSLIYDMDSKDRSLGLSCPPRPFLEDEVLSRVRALLAEDGHFILNLVCRDTDLQTSIMDTLKRHFKHITSVKLHEEVNEIILATNGGSYTKEILEDAAKGLNTAARQKGLVKVKCVDLKDFLQSVDIIS